MKKLILILFLSLNSIIFAVHPVVYTKYHINKSTKPDTIEINVKSNGERKGAFKKKIDDDTTVEVKPFSSLKEEYNKKVKGSKYITITVKRTKLKDGLAYYKCYNGYSLYEFHVYQHDLSLRRGHKLRK